MTRPKYTYEVERDFSNWDETIFERCLRDGFNVFGSGPTPILLRSEKETEPAPDTRSLGNDNDPEALRSAAETIMANSRKIERLDDIEHSKSKPDANAANNKQKKGDSKDDART